MTMQTDVSATHLIASGTVSSNPQRLRSVSYRGDGTDGYIKFLDGGASGRLLLELDVGTSDTFTIYLLLPAEGIKFSTDIYVEMSHVAALTAFWS